MPRNSSGIYTLPGGNPVTPGDVIEASWANTTLEDVADALTNSLSRTGAGGMLAPFRIADGSISAPGLSYLNETNTGLYRSGSGSTWMAVLGVNVAQFSTVGLTIASAKALTALGNASVGGTFGVTGATTLASTLAVTGAITATGGVLGNITAGSGTSTFNNVVINGNLDMDAGSSGTITNLPNPTNPGDAANKAYVDSQDALRLALTGGTMTGAIAMSNNKVTGLATPTADQDAANKAYVDNVAQGIDAKASCKAATTANITLSGNQTIDGVAVVAGDRVLVKNQSSAAQNGIYVADSSTWSRSSDANTWDELVAAFTFVEQGTENGNNGFICTIAPGGTLGVTAVTWAQFSGAGQIIAGQGLSKTGNTIQVNTASSSRIVIGADDIDLATTGVVADTYKSVSVDAYGRVTAGTNPTTLAGFGIGDAYTQTQTNTLLAAKLSLAGGTMSGAIAMGTNKITGLGDPTTAQDAATKNYIDTIFGSTTTAAASAAAAAASASAASTSATNAASSATSASSSATSAAASATAAAASFDSFDDRYLGAKASDPTVDNDGNPLLTGALYWNTTVGQMRVYDGSAWIATYLPATGYMDLTTNQTAAGVKTFSSNPILSAGTANGVVYLNGSKALTSGSALTFDGTTLTSQAGVTTGVGGGGKYTIAYTSANANSRSWRIANDLNVFGDFAIQQSTTQTGSTFRDVYTALNDGTSYWSVGGSEQMRLTSTGLGIGTSSPAYKLHVAGAPAATSGALVYLRDTTAAAGTASLGGIAFFSSPGSDFYVGKKNNTAGTGWLSFGNADNGTEYMALDASGNLGLGVTPTSGGATTNFEMGPYGATIAARNNASAPQLYISSNAVGQGYSPTYKINGYATQYQMQGFDGTHKWLVAPSGTAGNAITFTQAMTLNASGNLSIGTTSPYGTGRLTLVPSTNPTSSTDANNQLFIGEASANNSYYLNVGYINVGGGYAGSIQAIGGGVPCNLLLNSSGGNVLVGTTTARGQAGISLIPNTSAGAGEITFNRASTGSTSYVVGFQNAGSTVGYISYTNSATTYATSSDARLKENVSAAPDAGPVIDSIQIRSFDWKVGGHQTFGVVAQELVLVAPEAVAAPEDPDQMMGVDYSKLVPMMIKEIQSLRARLAAANI